MALITSSFLLFLIALVGAAACATAYVYGYVIRSAGDRRFHTAGLLFSGLALVSAAALLRANSREVASLNEAFLVGFLILGALCQAVTALRARRGDRRVPNASVERRSSDRRALPSKAG